MLKASLKGRLSLIASAACSGNRLNDPDHTLEMVAFIDEMMADLCKDLDIGVCEVVGPAGDFIEKA